MTREDLLEIDRTLEELLLCGDLDDDQHDLIERCLDQGYLQLASPDKAQVRRLLNQHGSGSKPRSPGGSALQRWRERRRQAAARMADNTRQIAAVSHPKRN